jgi:hypothetical protein
MQTLGPLHCLAQHRFYVSSSEVYEASERKQQEATKKAAQHKGGRGTDECVCAAPSSFVRGSSGGLPLCSRRRFNTNAAAAARGRDGDGDVDGQERERRPRACVCLRERVVFNWRFVIIILQRYIITITIISSLMHTITPIIITLHTWKNKSNPLVPYHIRLPVFT